MAHPPALDCWYLTGPTASGKTGIGICLARMLNAEIISLDSMAIYREMDIGTAKPNAEQCDAVPHHMVDFVCPTNEYSLSQYVEAAHQLIGEIRSRGREPLFVGGTPLYLKSMLRGIFEGPNADWQLRRELQEEVDRDGPMKLHERLRAIDPVSADRLHPNDSRRVIRAIEVYQKLGRPISELQQQFEKPQGPGPFRVFMLDWPRDVLYDRINRRVDIMLDDGLVNEVRQLYEKYQPLGRTAAQGVGFRELIDYLEGRCSLERAVELIKTHTRQFAKRQCTWFRSLDECRRIEMAEPVDSEAVARHILKQADQNR